MIFQATWEKMLSGEKYMTRRIVKPGEMALYDVSAIQERDDVRLFFNAHHQPMVAYPVELESQITISCVLTANEHRKWCVGRSYSIQPGRGQKALGCRTLAAIRQEHLQDITEDDAIAEGCSPAVAMDGERLYSARAEYQLLWINLHDRRGERWADNPLCWVLEFQRPVVSELELVAHWE